MYYVDSYTVTCTSSPFSAFSDPQIGTNQMAVCAKAQNKPFYVVAESFKFVRLFPLNQQDVPDKFKASSTQGQGQVPAKLQDPECSEGSSLPAVTRVKPCACCGRQGGWQGSPHFVTSGPGLAPTPTPPLWSWSVLSLWPLNSSSLSCAWGSS